MHDNKKSTLISSIIYLVILVIGLLLIAVAQGIDIKWLKVDLGNLLANFGALILLVGGIQWAFDFYVKHDLIDEINNRTIKNTNLISSGIDDVCLNSKKIDYTDSIISSTNLIIGLHYSYRLLDEHIDALKNRTKSGKKTSIFHLDPNCDAANLIAALNPDEEQIKPNINKIKSIVNEISGDSGLVKLIPHKTILRYSFVCTDNEIWIKPYKNSNGRTNMPAIKIKSNTYLYNFYSYDIDNMIPGAV